MSTVIDAGSLSASIVRDLIRDSLRDAFGSGELTDPRAGERPSGEEFVLTSYPDRDVMPPIIVVEEENDSASRIDARQAVHSHDYDVSLEIQDPNQTYLKNLRDGIRGHVLTNTIELGEQGFMEISIVNSTPVGFGSRDRSHTWGFVIGGTVVTGDVGT